MRKEPFTVGNYVHVYNRGNRKMPIVHDDHDRWRFLKILRYFNDDYSPENIFRMVDQTFQRPSDWPTPKPLVKILSFCLMPNHFHLLLKEIIDGGITKFMMKLGTGLTNFLNTKYHESGRVFQGPYKARTIKDDQYLQYLDVYIHVLNPLELYPGGLEKALTQFDEALEFAVNYSFCGLPDVLRKRSLSIIDRDILKDWFSSLKAYKEFAYEAAVVKNTKEMLGKLAID